MSTRKRRLRALSLPVFMLLAAPSATQAAAPKRPNVLFILIDTLRSDHLGYHGYRRQTSPALDLLAREGLTFADCYSVSNWTIPTIASLFTGRNPAALFPEVHVREVMKIPLPTTVSTLAEVLKADGYRTVGVSAHPAIGSTQEFDRGFENFVPIWQTRGGKGRWGPVTREAYFEDVSRILRQEDPRPFFVYLHIVYPHLPYDPPEPYLTMFGPAHTRDVRAQREKMINAYDGEIRYTDDLVRDILSMMTKEKLTSSTVVFVTSDHGEEFWEHGRFEHGQTFYDEVVKVPLIISGPPSLIGSPRLVRGAVSNIDIFPTVLEVTGARSRDRPAGRSLLRFRDPSVDPDNRPIFITNPHRFDYHGSALVQGNLKFHFYPTLRRNRQRLFDLTVDRGEKRNIAVKRRSAATELREMSRTHRRQNARRRNGQTRRAVPDPGVIEGMKSLGYLQ